MLEIAPVRLSRHRSARMATSLQQTRTVMRLCCMRTGYCLLEAPLLVRGWEQGPALRSKTHRCCTRTGCQPLRRPLQAKE